MEDNELCALLRYNRQTNIELAAIIIMVMFALFAMVLLSLGEVFLSIYFEISALVFFILIFGVLTQRTSRTAAFIRSRQPIKTIEW